MQPLPAATAATPAPETPSCTPLATPTPRRPNVPLRIREWILSRVSQFQYHEKGIRTKEEKQAFIIELSTKLNERFSNETGRWDEARTGTFVRNLKKTKIEATRMPSPSTTTAVATKSPMEQLLLDWQVLLQTSSRLNSNNLARHPSDRGSCNEDLIKGFLSSVLCSSRFIGIGSGEIFTSGGRKEKTRQLDIILYNPDFPCLRPARFSGDDGCCCFYEESIMLVIEVKTTLTNQDLCDVGLAASMLPSHIPMLIVSFDSQSTLKAIDTTRLPENVKGIFTLSHGSIIKKDHDDEWFVLHPSKRAPLVAFYDCVLQQLLNYVLEWNERVESSSAFIRVLETLMNQVSMEVHATNASHKGQEEGDVSLLMEALPEIDTK